MAAISACMWMAAWGMVASDAGGYARPQLLVEPAALAQPDVARQYIVLDARARKSFDAERIPAARWVDAEQWAKAFGDGSDAKAWSERIGKLGIGAQSKVVVYDDVNFKDAARTWWILRYWGVADVHLLNGGWAGWQQAGLPIETSQPQAPVAVEFTATSRSKWLATKQQLLSSLPGHTLQIIDARSEGEFCGVELHKNKRGGAIPGAKHLDWVELVNKQTHRFKSAAELRTLFAAAGIDLHRPAATHCQSGGRASVMVFAMELLGDDQVSNYYASWAEWGNEDDTPIVTAPPKPAPPAPAEK